MKDRTPRYPNRIKLTHEDGSVEYVIWERADDPIESGTPLNKNTLLQDDTAALVSLDDTATVDSVLFRTLMLTQDDYPASELEDIQLESRSLTVAPSWVTVSFGRTFNGTPTVYAIVQGDSTFWVQINNVTPTSFQCRVLELVVTTGTSAYISGGYVKTAAISAVTTDKTITYIAIYDGGINT